MKQYLFLSLLVLCSITHTADIHRALMGQLPKPGKHDGPADISFAFEKENLTHVIDFFAAKKKINVVLPAGNDATLLAQHIEHKGILSVPLTYCISTATALPDQRTQDINLRQAEFAPTSEGLFVKQSITALTLFVATFAILLTHNYLQIRTLRNEAAASKKEAVTALTRRFKDLSGTSIDSLLDDARHQVEAEEKLWSPFSAASRNSFLYYLLELTRLDKKSLELIVNKVTLDQDKRTMHLKAQVKDTDALALLEQELRQSGLFSYVQSPDYPSFDMELRFADVPHKETP